MIGNWLNGLTTVQEDRVLTSPVEPYGIEACPHTGRLMSAEPGNAPCLTEVADCQPPGTYRIPTNRVGGWRSQTERFSDKHLICVEGQYDQACYRFGVERVNGAIRNRILRNRLRRLPAPAPRDTAVLPLLAHSLETCEAA